jgi:hypothetical protein
MGTKHIKKIFDQDFQNKVIKKYLDLKSIKKVSNIFNITTRQVVNILNDNNIEHLKRRRTLLDESYFDKYNDDYIGAEVMYWAGFIAADGNVMNKSSSRSYNMTVNLSIKDINHLEKLKNSLKSTSKLRIYNNKGGVRFNKIFKDTTGCSISFASKYLVNSLEKFNIIPAKSKIYSITKCLYNHKFINHFIRGYMDGDGGVLFNDKYKRVYFYGTKECLNGISEIILKSCNIIKKAVSNNRSIYSIQYNGKDAINLVKWMYKDSSIYLERKYNCIRGLL